MPNTAYKISPLTENCKICGNYLVEKSHIPFIPRAPHSLVIYGPGSANIATEADKIVDSVYCPTCRVKYEPFEES